MKKEAHLLCRLPISASALVSAFLILSLYAFPCPSIDSKPSFIKYSSLEHVHIAENAVRKECGNATIFLDNVYMESGWWDYQITYNYYWYINNTTHNDLSIIVNAKTNSVDTILGPYLSWHSHLNFSLSNWTIDNAEAYNIVLNDPEYGPLFEHKTDIMNLYYRGTIEYSPQWSISYRYYVEDAVSSSLYTVYVDAMTGEILDYYDEGEMDRATEQEPDEDSYYCCGFPFSFFFFILVHLVHSGLYKSIFLSLTFISMIILTIIPAQKIWARLVGYNNQRKR